MGRQNRGNRYSNERVIRVVDNSGEGGSSYTHYSKRPFNRGGYSNFQSDRGGPPRFQRGKSTYSLYRGTFKKAIQHVYNRGAALTSDGDLDMPVEQEAWCKVTVMFGSNYTREWLHRELAKAVGTGDLVIFNFRFETRNAVFFIKIRRSQLSTYRSAANVMRDPNTGNKVIMNIVTVGEPTLMGMTDDVLSKIKLSLQSRFNPTTMTLNLSAFHKDVDLLRSGFYVPFNRGVVISTIVQLINDNLNELYGLNLSDNRLDSLSGFAAMIDKFKTLRSIDLSMNNFRNINSIEKLAVLPNLEEINLLNTPFSRRFQSVEQLGTNIRERIAGLQRLNMKTLTAVAEFEIQKAAKKPLPHAQLGSFPNDDIKNVLLVLVKTYMDKYDSGRRQQLLTYYSDISVMTLSATYHSLNTTSQNYSNASSRLHTSYLSENRNLLRCKDNERRRKLVKTGALHIVTMLDTLPRTDHKLESFNVDVIHAAANVLVFRMNGVFFEVPDTDEEGRDGASRVLRSFVRTMVIQPPEVIVQDDFFVTNPTWQTCKKYLSTGKPSTAPAPVHPTPLSAGVVPTVPMKQEPGVIPHEILMNDFARESGMNVAFSRKCLEDCAWDYNAAAMSFTQLHREGKIPPEAFQPI